MTRHDFLNHEHGRPIFLQRTNTACKSKENSFSPLQELTYSQVAHRESSGKEIRVDEASCAISVS